MRAHYFLEKTSYQIIYIFLKYMQMLILKIVYCFNGTSTLFANCLRWTDKCSWIVSLRLPNFLSKRITNMQILSFICLNKLFIFKLFSIIFWSLLLSFYLKKTKNVVLSVSPNVKWVWLAKRNEASSRSTIWVERCEFISKMFSFGFSWDLHRKN